MTHTTDNITINCGRHTYFGSPIMIQGKAQITITIGSFCSIADAVRVIAQGGHRVDRITTYPFGHLKQDLFTGHDGSGHPVNKGFITIGSDVWIGHGVTLMDGVTIGHGACIAAMSHVTGDVPPYAIYGGNPARLIRYRFTPFIIERLLELAWWDWTDDKINDSLWWLCDSPDAAKELWRA